MIPFDNFFHPIYVCVYMYIHMVYIYDIDTCPYTFMVYVHSYLLFTLYYLQTI